MRDLYHSALGDPPKGATLERFTAVNGEGFVHDIMSTDYLPEPYQNCDVLYGDPPWQRGYKTFAERCCVEPAKTYDTFMWHVIDLIDRSELPAVMIVGKQAAKYFEGWRAVPVRLQRFDAVAYYKDVKPEIGMRR